VLPNMQKAEVSELSIGYKEGNRGDALRWSGSARPQQKNDRSWFAVTENVTTLRSGILRIQLFNRHGSDVQCSLHLEHRI